MKSVLRASFPQMPLPSLRPPGSCTWDQSGPSLSLPLLSCLAQELFAQTQGGSGKGGTPRRRPSTTFPA